MIELKEYNSFKNTVFIDGEVLPRQLVKNPRIGKKYIIVDVISDERLHLFDYSKVKYQIKPLKIISKTEISVEISRLFLDKTKLK